MDHDHANGVMARALPGQAEKYAGGDERDLQQQLQQRMSSVASLA